ncbi:MAG: hypothetical protein KJ915_09095 [Candidatus Omnitrophica bacterium]|nr:hypothetical protein [Candidatus Omnitrophota bacterium]
MEIRKIISLVVIWSMGLSNLAFARDFNLKNIAQETLSPVLHIDTALFQQGFEHVSKISDLDSDEMGIYKLISQFIASSDDLQNNPIILDFLAKIKAASEEFKQGNKQMVLVGKGGKKKDIDKAFASGIKYWKKSVKSLEGIDIEKIDNSISQNDKQIAYAFLRLKAEVLFNIVETDRKLDLLINKKLEYYSEIRKLLERAIALPGDHIDSRGLTVLANACANLAAGEELSIQRKLKLSEDAALYFELAIDMQSDYSNNEESSAKVDQVYYSYFTALYLAGDICWTMKDYSKAIDFYEKAVPLCSRLRIYVTGLRGAKNLYKNYYRMLLEMGKDFQTNRVEGSSEDKVKSEALFRKTILIAHDSMSFYNQDELLAGDNLDAMACSFRAQEKLVRESLRNKDWVEVGNRLSPLIMQLKQMNKITCKDQHNNYSIALMNTELIKIVYDIIREYIRINRSSSESIVRMAEILDKDFFFSFLEKVQAGEYNDILKKIKKEDKLNDALLWKALISGSPVYTKICRYLENALIPNNVLLKSREDNETRIDKNRKFRADHAYSASTLLAFTYMQKGDYSLAVSKIRDVSKGYEENFLNDKFFVEQILVQAILAQEKGKNFIAKLLLTTEGKTIAANIINHQKLLIPQASEMLIDIINNNPKLREYNPKLLEVLGIVIPELDIAELVVKKVKNIDDREVVKSFEVLRKPVAEALSLLDSQLNNKLSRAQRRKGKAGKQISLHVKAGSIRQMENALEEMITADKKRRVKPVFDYIKNQIIKEPVFKNRFAMGSFVWTVTSMDSAQALDILNACAKVYGEDSLSGQELVRALGAVKSFEAYKEQMLALEDKIINSPKLETSGGVYIGLNFSEVNQSLDDLAKKANFLRQKFLDEMVEYFSKDDRYVNESKYLQVQQDWVEQHAKQINSLLIELRAQNTLTEQLRIKTKAEEFVNTLKEFENAILHALDKAAKVAMSEEKSPAEKVLYLRQWDKDLIMPVPDEDINALPALQAALSQTNDILTNHDKEIKAYERRLCGIFKGKISFDISEDLSTIYFQEEALTLSDMKQEKDIIIEMCAVVEAVLLENYDINIQTAIKGKANPSSKVFFLPLLATVKDRMIQVQEKKYKAVKIIQEIDDFFNSYEEKVEKIIGSSMSRIEKIRQLDILLDDTYNQTVIDKMIENQGFIAGEYEDEWNKRYDDIDAQHLSLQIGNGAIEVHVVGDYERLEFTFNGDMDFRADESEIREIWQGTLAANMGIEMQLRNGKDRAASWVAHIRDIWEEEYDLVEEAKKNKENLNQPVEVDSKSLIENIMAVACSI